MSRLILSILSSLRRNRSGRALPVFILALYLLIGSGTSPAEARTRPAFLSDDVSYFWPTNASRYMSSSFGETRATHFHAALDIGTWGHEGYAVFATRDGIVHRVAVGPVGYGNVIYLRHDDDSISLYAHLKDFHPKIRSIVDSLRLRDYSFDFNEHIESYDIRFQRGQQIGWTGSTGVGPPHLHFELRSPEGNPFNPLLAGIRIEDTIAPRFSGLAIEPLSPDSKINGEGKIFRSRPVFRNGQFHFDTVDVQGEVGLAVDVFDRANASNNVHAVYELAMYVNNERYFHSRVDSFSYSQSRQMFLDRVYPILATERRGFQRLYIRSGNTLSFYSETGHTGRLRLPPGTHQIRIEASDYFGNRAVANIRMNISGTDSPYNIKEQMDLARKTNTKRANSAPAGLQWHKNWVRPISKTVRQNQSDGLTHQGNPVSPDETYWSIRKFGSFQKEHYKYVYRGQGLPLNLSDRMELSNGDSIWVLHRIHPEYPLSLYHDKMQVVVHFPAKSFFEPVTIGIAGTRDEFTLFPNIEPFQRPAAVRILLDETLKEKNGLGLYRKNLSNNRLTHITSYRNTQGNELVGTIQSGGYYVIRSDTTAPEISTPKIGRWRHSGLYYVTVSIDDDLSGINYRSAEFYVNGHRGIAEYDPEKKLLRYHHPDFKPENSNHITVRLSDRAGNSTEKIFSDVPYN